MEQEVLIKELRILLLEDVPSDAELVTHALRGAGIAFVSERVDTRDAFITALEVFKPDIVLADYKLPAFDGRTALDIVRREHSEVPVIMVTGALGDEAAIDLLKAGARDYVLKDNLTRLGSAVEQALAIGRGIRARKVTELALQESELRYRRLFEAAHDGILLLNATTGQIEDVNPFLIEMLGYSHSEFLGKTLWEVGALKDTALSKEAFEELQLSGYIRYEDLPLQAKDGQLIEVEFVSNIYTSNGGKVIQCNIRDITARKKSEARVEFLATHDALTQLPNRNLLKDRLTQSITHARRTGQALALLFLDLDRFKIVNDSFGHSVGDALLKEVAARIQQVLREDDTVARLGGDEFFILLAGLERRDSIATATAKILDVFARPFAVDDQELYITASVGISLYPDDGKFAEELLKDADTAMYRAKQQGGNSFQFYTAEMGAYAVERMDMENALRHALTNRELLLHYQPQVDLRSGRIVGAEALVRWQHPQRGLIAPDHFIPLAEETGLIVPLGEWVLRQACAQQCAWRDAGLPPMRIGVNVSARQCWQGDLARSITQVMNETDIDPRALELEVTESMVMPDKGDAIQMLTELKALGVSIAIDDFGTGYSSLGYLRHLPIDKLKIGPTFMKSVEQDSGAATLVREIINLTHGLQLKAIAEGVEKSSDLTVLHECGCDEMQGYYFSRPVTAAAFGRLIGVNQRHLDA